eukprot:TRINITY_DN21108_c0_g1_i1.p1 TRINITY_DN21108_c0_g1~~TRINITY_DN21108_c0_g1_i1.p1  ORF type:complete len:176 (-),score=14.37 TRINITY_DN21108_c0_g1_i1:222-713(-)
MAQHVGWESPWNGVRVQLNNPGITRRVAVQHCLWARGGVANRGATAHGIADDPSIDLAGRMACSQISIGVGDIVFRMKHHVQGLSAKWSGPFVVTEMPTPQTATIQLAAPSGSGSIANWTSDIDQVKKKHLLPSEKTIRRWKRQGRAGRKSAKAHSARGRAER